MKLMASATSEQDLAITSNQAGDNDFSRGDPEASTWLVRYLLASYFAPLAVLDSPFGPLESSPNEALRWKN